MKIKFLIFLIIALVLCAFGCAKSKSKTSNADPTGGAVIGQGNGFTFDLSGANTYAVTDMFGSRSGLGQGMGKSNSKYSDSIKNPVKGFSDFFEMPSFFDNTNLFGIKTDGTIYPAIKGKTVESVTALSNALYIDFTFGEHAILKKDGTSIKLSFINRLFSKTESNNLIFNDGSIYVSNSGEYKKLLPNTDNVFVKGVSGDFVFISDSSHKSYTIDTNSGAIIDSYDPFSFDVGGKLFQKNKIIDPKTGTQISTDLNFDGYKVNANIVEQNKTTFLMSNSIGFSINSLSEDGSYENIYTSHDTFYSAITSSLSNESKFLFKARDKFVVRESKSISVVQKNYEKKDFLQNEIGKVKTLSVYDEQIYYGADENLGILNFETSKQINVQFESEIIQLESFVD